MDDKWFKRQQKIAGITAEDIAARIGRDRSLVSRILNGRQRMSLEWAKAFSDALGVPLATVLEKAGVTGSETVAQLSPGFAEADAVPFVHRPEDPGAMIARALGADRPGVDVWRVKGEAMMLDGTLPGDHLLVDTHQAERCSAGDLVLVQIYSRTDATTLLRRYEPPVLVAASPHAADRRVHVVDGVNVVIRGKVIASWRV